MMGFVQLEWFVAMVAVTVGIVAAIAVRRREPKKPAPETFQDMSIFDDEVASGNYEIDPIAEAEVYLAYGNKQQAMNLLNKAALDHPERQDIQDKIREIDAVLVPPLRRR
jgi:Tfp pilus assembly protein FimV